MRGRGICLCLFQPFPDTVNGVVQVVGEVGAELADGFLPGTEELLGAEPEFRWYVRFVLQGKEDAQQGWSAVFFLAVKLPGKLPCFLNAGAGFAEVVENPAAEHRRSPQPDGPLKTGRRSPIVRRQGDVGIVAGKLQVQAGTPRIVGDAVGEKLQPPLCVLVGKYSLIVLGKVAICTHLRNSVTRHIL